MARGARIDPATGRKVRESPQKKAGRDGLRPERSGGRIVPKGRLAAARARGTRSTR